MTTTHTVFLPTDDPLAAEQHAIEALGEMVAATTTGYSTHDADRFAHEVTDAPDTFGGSQQFTHVAAHAAVNGISWTLWHGGAFQITAGPHPAPRAPNPLAGSADYTRAIQDWASRYLGSVPGASWAIGQSLVRLHGRTLDNWHDAGGGEPSEEEFFDGYSGGLDQYGFRWNPDTFTVEPSSWTLPDPVVTQTQTIDRWCDDFYKASWNSDHETAAGRLRVLGENVWANFVDDKGRDPDPVEFLDWYLAVLAEHGYRWDEQIHSVVPIDPAAKVAASGPVARKPEPRVWFLTGDELAATRARIGKLNARAARKGFTGCVELTAAPTTRSHTPAAGALPVTLHGFDVALAGQPPVYAGWQFVAAVDKIGDPTPAPLTRGWALEAPPYFYDIQRIRSSSNGEPQRVEDALDAADLGPGERLAWSVYEVAPDGLSHLVDDFDSLAQAKAAAAQLTTGYATTGQPRYPLPATPAPVVIRYPPGADQVVDHSAVRPGECDHCHTVRPRSTTFLIRHKETGELKQVGRSCLKGFLGTSATPVFLDTDQIGDDIDKSRDPHTRQWAIESVLAYAWAVVAAHGRTPASAAGTRTATRDLVADALIGGMHARDLLASISGHLDEGQQMAGRILAELPRHLSSGSGYEANLAAILGAGSVGPKHLGLAVSAVNAWNRLVERQVTDEVRGHRRDNLTHTGTVGEPITLTGTVITATRVPGYHYRSADQALLVIDCGTAIAKTITSAAWAYQVERGNQLTITGTVKAHDEYHGVPQTVLTPPKRIDDPTPTARTQPIPDPAPETLCDAAWEVVNATQAGPRPFPGPPHPLAETPQDRAVNL